jgi:hypothetical protein
MPIITEFVKSLLLFAVNARYPKSHKIEKRIARSCSTVRHRQDDDTAKPPCRVAAKPFKVESLGRGAPLTSDITTPTGLKPEKRGDTMHDKEPAVAAASDIGSRGPTRSSRDSPRAFAFFQNADRA